MNRLPRAALLARLVPIAALLCLAPLPLAAQTAGSASGKGVMERQVQTPEEGLHDETVPFAPRFALAYQQKDTGGTTVTWLVLTDKEPPLKAWAATPVKDRAKARQSWCETEKGAFVAAEVQPSGIVELYLHCPGNGQVSTELVSSINGLRGVVVAFTRRDATRLQGKMTTGSGFCNDGYCTPTGDYTFDAPLTP